MQEHQKLQKRLQTLKSIQQSGGIQGSTSRIEEHKNLLRGEFEKFKDLSSKEVQRLRAQQSDIEVAVESVKHELQSERPLTGSMDIQNTNLTMTSNFSIQTVDVEELRQ